MHYNVLINIKNECTGINFYAISEEQLKVLIKLTMQHDYEISITKAYEE